MDLDNLHIFAANTENISETHYIMIASPNSITVDMSMAPAHAATAKPSKSLQTVECEPKSSYQALSCEYK